MASGIAAILLVCTAGMEAGVGGGGVGGIFVVVVGANGLSTWVHHTRAKQSFCAAPSNGSRLSLFLRREVAQSNGLLVVRWAA